MNISGHLSILSDAKSCFDNIEAFLFFRGKTSFLLIGGTEEKSSEIDVLVTG